MEEVILNALDDFEGPIAIGLRSGHVSRANVTLTLGVEAELDRHVMNPNCACWNRRWRDRSATSIKPKAHSSERHLRYGDGFARRPACAKKAAGLPAPMLLRIRR